MAKLTDIPVVTSLATDDLVYAVDTSDTTDDPAGSLVAITQANLLAGVGGGANGPSKELITELTDPTTAELDIAIPSGYDRITIVFTGKTNGATAQDDISWSVNNDTTATNYDTQYNLSYSNSESNAWLTNNRQLCSFSGASSPGIATVSLVIERPDDASSWTVVSAWQNTSLTASAIFTGVSSSHHKVAGAMTSIQFTPATGTAFIGDVKVYGEKDVSFAASETITVKQEVPVVLSGGEFTIDLTNYQGGDRVVIQGQMRNTVTGTAVKMFLNGDVTDANYRSQLLRTGDLSNVVNEFDEPRIAYVSDNTAPANQYAQVEIVLEEYTGSKLKTATGKFVANQSATTMWTGNYGYISEVISAPVTSITIADNAGSGTLTGDVKCYIEKQGVLPVIPPADNIPSNAASHFLIEEITNTTPGEFDFTVPSGYDRLIVEGYVKSNATGTVEAVTCFVNEELTTTDYWYQTISASNGVVNVNEGPVAFAGLCTTDNALPANMQTDISVIFEAPDVPNKTKSYLATVVTGSAAEDVATGVYSTRSPVDAPITRLRFRTDNYPTDQLVGSLRLIGVRAVSIESSDTITVKQEVPVVLNAGEFEIDLTNYQDGDRLVIEGMASSTTVGEDLMYYTVNGDTTNANYRRSRSICGFSGSSEAYGVANDRFLGEVTGTSGLGQAAFTIVCEDYAGIGGKVCHGRITTPNSTTATKMGIFSSYWNGSGPITSLVLSTLDVATLSGDVKCYVEKQGVLPMTTPTVTNMPVVQSAWITPAGAVGWSSEPGWSCSKAGLGLYNVTFPSAAAGDNEQSIVATAENEDGQLSGAMATVKLVTPTTCQVVVSLHEDTKVDSRGIFIQRRLPDAPAQALVATQPAGTVVREEIARITDPVSGEFDFTSIPSGYDRLIIKGTARSNYAGTSGDAVWIEYNGDTDTTNYVYQQSSAQSGVANVNNGSPSLFAFVPGAGAPTDSLASITCEIEDYATVKAIHVGRSESAADLDTTYPSTILAAIRNIAHFWQPNAPTAVTSILITPNVGTVLTGTLVLYGERTI